MSVSLYLARPWVSCFEGEDDAAKAAAEKAAAEAAAAAAATAAVTVAYWPAPGECVTSSTAAFAGANAMIPANRIAMIRENRTLPIILESSLLSF